MEKLNYYDILGIEVDAPQRKVRKAYRRLVKQHHPDLNERSKESHEKFKKIQEAYNILGNPEKRRRYDRKLRNPGYDRVVVDYRIRGNEKVMEEIIMRMFRDLTF